jgi:hypothetical protein
MYYIITINNNVILITKVKCLYFAIIVHKLVTYFNTTFPNQIALFDVKIV